MEEKKIKIEIKNRFTGKVLFEYEKVNNTVKDTLVEAVKCCAELRGANLRGAYLCGANLRGANLIGANLRDANLVGANLRDAYLAFAYLSGAENVPYIPFACPSDGAFIGWKKVNGLLVKLEIPEDARRCSAAGTKCRCDYAKVLKIIDPEDETKVIDEVVNKEYAKTVYKVGENVYPDSFDENRWNECSHGIHFFINKQEAIDY